MNGWTGAALQLAACALQLLFNGRFLCRMLGRRWPLPATFAALALFELVWSGANVVFRFAGSLPANALYYCAGRLLLYAALFHGGLLKKAFLTALLWCGEGAVFYMLMPLDIAAFDAAGRVGEWASGLAALNLVIQLLMGALLEYAGKRLGGLRREPPAGYTLFLLLLTAFVFTATAAVTETSIFFLDPPSPLALALFCSLFAFTGACLILLSVVSADRHAALLLAGQHREQLAAHIRGKQEDWRRVSRFRHDLQNHLLCLGGLLRAGQAERALAYLEALEGAAARLESPVRTGNDFADAILGEKYAGALANGVDCRLDMTLPAESRIDPVDLCCILSNLFDNAVEACALIGAGEGRRWIEARAFVRQSQLVLEVKNSAAGPRPGHRREPGRGFGLENVRETVERYGGALEVRAGRDFEVSALIPLE